MEFQEEQQIQPVTLVAPIYSATQIRLGTFLGGPLVAGYFIAENYKVFGEEGKARAAWIYAIAFTIALFGGIFAIPANVKVPGYIIPIIYCWITFYLVQHFQGKQIDALTNGGEGLFSWWRVVLIGLIGLAVTVALLVIVVLATVSL